jgi:hypothetical protein
MIDLIQHCLSFVVDNDGPLCCRRVLLAVMITAVLFSGSPNMSSKIPNSIRMTTVPCRSLFGDKNDDGTGDHCRRDIIEAGGCRWKEVGLLFGLPQYYLGSSTMTTSQGTIADGTQRTPMHRMERSTVDCASQGNGGVMEDHHC